MTPLSHTQVVIVVSVRREELVHAMASMMFSLLQIGREELILLENFHLHFDCYLTYVP